MAPKNFESSKTKKIYIILSQMAVIGTIQKEAFCKCLTLPYDAPIRGYHQNHYHCYHPCPLNQIQKFSKISIIPCCNKLNLYWDILSNHFLFDYLGVASLIVSMDFSKFNLMAKCETMECHIIVLRYGPTLARYVVSIISESKPIHGLYQMYINIFGVTSETKHNSDFIYYSQKKVISKFLNLFCVCQLVFFFCDDGSHHYKSRHEFLGFAMIAKELRLFL